MARFFFSEPVKAEASKHAVKIRKPGKWDAIMDRLVTLNVIIS